MSYKFLTDLRFIPDGLTAVTAATPLADGVTMGTFLTDVTLDHIPELSDRIQIARNLLPHAHIIKSIRDSDKRFAKYKMVVVEGIYKKSLEEQITAGGQKDLAQVGRSVVYELRRDGVTDNAKTVELALYLAVFYKMYDKLTLDYDTYNEGELNAQIIIDTPDMPSSYNIRFQLSTQTKFNNVVQADGQLVEITEIPNTSVVIPAPLPDQVGGYFTVGDHHARQLRVYGGSPWQSFARDGRTSRDNAIIENIKKISSNNIVVVSVGYNDTVITQDTPETIAARVHNIVGESIKLGHDVTYLLFPVTNSLGASRQIAVRNAIVNKLGVFTQLAIIDLNHASYVIDVDGISLTRESYISVSNKLV